MTADVDVAILGGGCAGLSLAVALAQHAPTLRVELLESRTHYRRDRTWCFWNTAEHPFTTAVTHRWHAWRVRHGGLDARQQSRRYSYQHLPADRFYDLAVDRVHRAEQRLHMGVNVHGIQQADGLCTVHTDQGALRARWVFDSRPHSPDEAQPMLLQRFLGWHIRCENPCFDPATVDLMDFQPCTGPGRTAFFYVLPFSSTEALVEATFLESPSLPAPDPSAMLRDYLRHRNTGTYQCLYEEAATLPMGTWQSSPPPSSGPVVAIGARGGRIKSSSGYAFQRIQRQSRAFAQALSRGSRLPRHVEPAAYGLLDRIFLHALLRSPERTAGYFTALFQTVAPDTLVRFLSEVASLPEIAQVMLALPKWDFLKAALLPPRQGASA